MFIFLPFVFNLPFCFRGNSTVPSFFFGVRYPLVGNLLYQVTKTSHLMVLSLHCVVITSHVIVLLSHLVVLLFFFSHLMVPSLHCVILTSYVIVLLSHLMVLLFFLTFDDTILTLYSTNITCDCILPHLVVHFFFSHLIVPSSHYAIPISYVTVFCHIWWFIYFFSHI